MFYRYLIGLISLFPTISLSQSTDVEINVFTTEHYAIQHPEIANNVFFLDEVDNLENALAAQLSTNPNTAEKQVKAFFASEEGRKFQLQLQKAYVGITEGWKTGVLKVPAIVFDDGKRTGVIYGETNVHKAKQRWQQWVTETTD